MKSAEILAGTGVGILTGLLIGLSVSPVVGPTLGAILAFGMLWLGYKEHQELNLGTANPALVARARHAIAIRMACFSISCSAGLLLGLFLRANDTFSPTLESRRNELVRLGFSRERANELLVQQERGGALSGESRPEAHTMLYSQSGMPPPLVHRLNPTNYSDSASCLLSYESLGVKWREAAVLIEKIDGETNRLRALHAVHLILSKRED